MIPKTIHYCWLEGKEKPQLARECIESWKTLCPDYEIREWNQQNIEIEAYPQMVQAAWQANAWDYVADYVSLDVVFRYGGIYLNVGTKLCKKLDELLAYSAFFEFEEEKWIAPYVGFGAESGAQIVKELLDTYFDYPRFLDNATYMRVAASQRNMRPFLKRGLLQNGKSQILEDQIWIADSSSLFHPETRKNGCLLYGENAKSFLWKYASFIYRMFVRNGWQRYSEWKSKRELRVVYNEKLMMTSSVDDINAAACIETYYKKGKPLFSQPTEIDPVCDLMIIIPVYRTEMYIDQCVQSVLTQKTKYSYIAVFIDDGSPDRCGEILDEYSKHDRIRVIHQKNRGFSGARNRALESICGKYVMFLDSDDYLPDYAVEVLLDEAYQNDADVAEGCLAVFAEDRVIAPDLHIRKKGEVAEKELTGYPVAKVIRGELFANLCFPTDIWFEDTMIKTLLYPQCKKVVAVPDVVYFYRKNLNGISSTCRQNVRCIDTYWITKYYLEEKKERGHSFGEEEYRQFLLQCKTNQLRLSEMPEILQESVFVMTCKLRKEYFEGVSVPLEGKYEMLDVALQRKSFSAYKHVLSNWDRT